MRTPLLFSPLLSLIVLAGCGGGEQPATQSPTRVTYTITDLGKGDTAETVRINNLGEMMTTIQSPSPTQAAVYRNGSWVKLGSLGGSDSRAYALNDEGVVVGHSRLSSGQLHAFVWQGNQIQDVNRPGDIEGIATDINNAGSIVIRGRSNQPSFLLLPDGTRTVLPFFPSALNEAGEIAGVQDFFPVVWKQGVVTRLGTLPGYGAGETTDINEKGQVVGLLGTYNISSRAFLWQKGQMTDLGTFGGPSSRATAINNRGEIVGDAETPEEHQSGIGQRSYVRHPFVYRDGKLWNLNELIPADSGWTLIEVLDINDAGQIVGHAERKNDPRATIIVLLTPTS
jgi:probable HAF family extracellular repeat protein